MVLAVEIVLVATVVFVVAALTVGRFDRLAPAVPDGPHVGLGGQPVAPGDVEAVRFGMAVRGYRMAEVDAVLSRLAHEIAWRDEELARRDDELLRLAELARLGGVQGSATDPADSAPGDIPDSVSNGVADGVSDGIPEHGPGHISDDIAPGRVAAHHAPTDSGAPADLGAAQGDARNDRPDRDEARGPRPVQDQPGEPGAASPDKGDDG